MSHYYTQALSVGQLAVLDTLRGIIARHSKSGRKYCFPSQDTILDYLSKYHHINICKSTLNNWLKKLEQNRLIHRIRRLSHVRFTSTVYYLLDRGGQGVVKAKKIIGTSKRLGSVLPARLEKIGNNRHTAQCQYSGGASKTKAAPATGKTKRCETSKLRKQSVPTPALEKRPREGEERPAFVRECIDKVKGLFKSKDALSEEGDGEPSESSRALTERREFLRAQCKEISKNKEEV